jgi:hypothetical protein
VEWENGAKSTDSGDFSGFFPLAAIGRAEYLAGSLLSVYSQRSAQSDRRTDSARRRKDFAASEIFIRPAAIR